MKKHVLLAALAILWIFLAACGGSDENKNDGAATKTSKSETGVKKGKKLTDEEFVKMYSNPDKYMGDRVDFYAQVFSVEKDDGGTYLQAWLDPEKSDKNILIGMNDSKLDVKEDDIVHVTGTVKGAYTGENLLGGKVTAPVILADSVEKADYAKAFAPTVKTIAVNQTKNQSGFVVKVDKVEVAKQETRVYLEVKNQTKDKIDFFEYNSKLVSGDKQLEVKDDNFVESYPKISDEILPGVTSKGVVVFPAIDAGTGRFTLHFEGASENYNLDIQPFVFNVAAKE